MEPVGFRLLPGSSLLVEPAALLDDICSQLDLGQRPIVPLFPPISAYPTGIAVRPHFWLLEVMNYVPRNVDEEEEPRNEEPKAEVKSCPGHAHRQECAEHGSAWTERLKGASRITVNPTRDALHPVGTTVRTLNLRHPLITSSGP